MRKNKIDISIIIVNWKSADYLLNCVKSIYRETNKVNFEVIVVDNASFDDCKDRLYAEFPDVKFFQSKKNLGFAKANNVGVQLSLGKIILFLNPDTKILDNAIDKLFYNFILIKRPGVVGCKLLNSDGSLQTSCIQSFPNIINQIFDANVLREIFPKAKIWGVKALFENNKKAVRVDSISGACMMIDRVAFEAVNCFSTDYFMYSEDVDLCYKTNEKKLYNYFFPDAKIVHYGGGSTKNEKGSFSNIMMRESRYRYFKKFFGKYYSRFYRISMMIVSGLRIFILISFFPIFLKKERKYIYKIAIKKWISIFIWAIGKDTFSKIK